MECSSSLSFCIPKRPLPLISTALFSSICSSSRKQQMPIVQLSAISYKKFINFALDETKRHTHLAPSPCRKDIILGSQWMGNQRLKCCHSKLLKLGFYVAFALRVKQCRYHAVICHFVYSIL
ncbi:unnamed protein product [Prunus armeniaca]